MYEYYVKVVPTKFQISRYSQDWISSNQYSVTEYSQSINLMDPLMNGAPGVVFLYELSPITIDFAVKHMSFLHFFTNLLAILGGIFTVSSLFDSIFFKISKFTKRRDHELAT